MKVLLFMACFFASSSLFAAKFQSIGQMQNPGLESLAKTVEKIANTKGSIHGDYSLIERYKVKKKSSELDINTMRQLFIAKAGLFAEDNEHLDITQNTDTNTFAMAKGLIDIYDVMGEGTILDTLTSEQYRVFKQNEELLAKKIYFGSDRLQNKALKFYEGMHSNEDGTWNVLSVYDKENKEVLLLAMGFWGT